MSAAGGPSAAPPGAWALPPPIERPPTAVPKVFGILSIVFGGWLLLSGLFSSLFIVIGPLLDNLADLAPPDAPQREVVREMMGIVGTIYTAVGIQGLIFAVMSGILLALGIGQLRYRRWAVRATVLWGIAALVLTVVMAGLSCLVLGPTLERAIETAAAADPHAEMPAGLGGIFGMLFGGTGGIATLIFYAPYPILLIAYFRKSYVQAAMNR